MGEKDKKDLFVAIAECVIGIQRRGMKPTKIVFNKRAKFPFEFCGIPVEFGELAEEVNFAVVTDEVTE